MILNLRYLLSAPTSGVYPASFKRTTVNLLPDVVCGSVGEGEEVVETRRDKTIRCVVSVLDAVGGVMLKLISDGDGDLGISCELWLFCHCFQTSAVAGRNHRCSHVTATRSERRSAVSCCAPPLPPVVDLHPVCFTVAVMYWLDFYGCWHSLVLITSKAHSFRKVSSLLEEKMKKNTVLTFSLVNWGVRQTAANTALKLHRNKIRPSHLVRLITPARMSKHLLFLLRFF